MRTLAVHRTWREGRDRRRVLPARRRPGARGVGASAGARGARGGAEVRVLVLHRPIPPGAALRGARRAAPSRRRCASRRGPSSTGSTCATSATSRRRAGGRTDRGGHGRPARCAARCFGCATSSRSTSCTPTTPRPPATRCGGPHPKFRWSCRRTAATCCPSCTAGRGLEPRSRARCTTPGSCWPTAPTPRGAVRSTARARRASCTWAPTCRGPATSTAGERAAVACHRGPSRRAQAPRGCGAGAVDAARPPSRAALRRRRRRPRAGAPARARARARRGRPRGAARPARPRPRRWPRRGAASAFVLPSVDEAFGVAYVEAMAGGVPAIGCRGEGGPEEIAAAGGGIRSFRPATSRPWPASWTASSPSPAGPASWVRPPGRRSRRSSPGSAAGRQTVEAYRAALA